MRLFVAGLLLAASTALAGAPAPSSAADAPPPSIWRLSGGAYEHLQSGLVCPETLAGYRRTVVQRFDVYGLDVGCNYTIGTAALTFYLTRREGPGGLDAALAEAKKELLDGGAARHAQFLSDTPTRTPSPDGDIDWTVSLFSEDGGLHSAIWITDLFGWTFEYRATYAAADEARVVGDIKTFTAAIRASAGTRLQLCARTPQPERPGKAVTDAEQIQSAAMMSSILGGAAQAAVADHKGKSDPASDLEAPPIWCVDTAVTKDGFPMVFWRGVRKDATNGLDDQITLAAGDKPVTLDLSAGGLEGLIEDTEKKGDTSDKPQQWKATLQNGDQTLIFGYFAGRPSADLVEDMFVRILSGKLKPVGGYSAHGKNINIMMSPK